MMADSKLMTLKLPRHLSAKVASLARKRRTTRSAIVRDAIAAYGESSDLSFADLTAEYCGIWRGGPRDLSTNPKHLRGYGR